MKELGKYEKISIIFSVIIFLGSIVAYFYLPDKIAVQWSGKEVTGTADKIYIMLFPIVSILLSFNGKNFIKSVGTKWFGASNDVLASYISMFLQIVLLTCLLFLVLFAFEIRLTISTILIIELVCGIVRGIKLINK